MESASLTYDQRLLAVQQLGRDYMAAGLYDRAEDMFKQLVDETDFRLGALQQLLQIYRTTSDWQSAIEVAERLVKLGKRNIVAKSPTSGANWPCSRWQPTIWIKRWRC